MSTGGKYNPLRPNTMKALTSLTGWRFISNVVCTTLMNGKEIVVVIPVNR